MLFVVAACDAASLDNFTVGPTASQPTESSPADEQPQDAFQPIRIQGTGNKVARFRIPSDVAAIAEISHNGASNFAVWTVARDGFQQDLLVNTIGDYSGTVLFDEESGQHSVAFKVEADGRWKIRVLPVTRAPQWNGNRALEGRGDSVIALNPPSSGLTTTTIRHDGSSNFVVYAYGQTSELLVNEIGRYRGESLLPDGTVVLEINADGRWSFSPLE